MKMIRTPTLTRWKRTDTLESIKIVRLAIRRVVKNLEPQRIYPHVLKESAGSVGRPHELFKVSMEEDSVLRKWKRVSTILIFIKGGEENAVNNRSVYESSQVVRKDKGANR